MPDAPVPADRAAAAALQWARERPDLDTKAMVVLGRLAEAALVIGRDRLHPLFTRHGLQPGEFDVLATLRRSGAPFSLTPTALYDAAMISSGSMTNRIDRLQQAGLVARSPNPEDGRGTLVALTPAGFALIDSMMAEYTAYQRQIVEPLNAAEQDTLAALLAKLLRSAG